MSSRYAEHYRSRVDAIAHVVARLPPKSPPQLVLLGDVIFEKDTLHNLAEYQILNMGIEGDEIDHPDGGLMRRLNLLPLARPKQVFVLIGLCDLLDTSKDVSSIEVQYEKMVQALRANASSAEIHLLAVLPTRGGYERLMPNIAMLNVVIEEIAERQKMKFVDTFVPMEDEEGHLTQNFTEDGLHLNDAGYEKLHEVLALHLKSGEAYL